MGSQTQRKPKPHMLVIKRVNYLQVSGYLIQKEIGLSEIKQEIEPYLPEHQDLSGLRSVVFEP